MKKKIAIVAAMYFSVCLFAQNYSVKDVFVDGFGFEIDMEEEIPQENLNIIYYVLAHTYENNIHKMRGESNNRVFTKTDGSEAVFDAEGKLVTNYNAGSFNFAKYEEPFNKWSLDIFPWIIWGSGNDDPTDSVERFYYYLWDVADCGIQYYIFEGSNKRLKKIKYKNLTNSEKHVVHLFNYILFNEKHDIEFNKKNAKNFQNDENLYYAYVTRIFDICGYNLSW